MGVVEALFINRNRKRKKYIRVEAGGVIYSLRSER